MMEGSQITIQLNPASADQTKLIVTSIPAGAGSKELTFHFTRWVNQPEKITPEEAYLTHSVAGEKKHEPCET